VKEYYKTFTSKSDLNMIKGFLLPLSIKKIKNQKEIFKKF